MQHTPHQMKDLLRSYCFSLLDLCRKRNFKNIALTWLTLGKNSKFDTLHSFQTHHGKKHIFLNVYILLYTYTLLCKLLHFILHLYTLVQHQATVFANGSLKKCIIDECIVFFNRNVSSYCLVFVKNKQGNAWFWRLQKSAEQTAVLNQSRNFILTCALNFAVDIILTYKTRF